MSVSISPSTADDQLTKAAPFHHYVPRFYLRGFYDPDLLENDPPQCVLWVYRRHRRPRSVGIKRVGGEPGFYRHEGGDFEQELCKREDQWARLLQKMLKEKRLYGSDRLEFSRFMGLMATRGPHFYDMTHTIASFLDEYISLHALNANEAQKIREQLTASNLLPPQITRQWTLREILETGRDMALLFDQMNWLVLAAGDGDYVVTSDTPVVLTDPHGPEFTTTGMRFSADAELTFPLDRQHVLFGSRKRSEGVIHDRGYVFRHINRRTIKRAYKAVYASVNSAGLADLVNREIRDERLSIKKEKLFANIDEVREKWA